MADNSYIIEDRAKRNVFELAAARLFDTNRMS